MQILLTEQGILYTIIRGKGVCSANYGCLSRVYCIQLYEVKGKRVLCSRIYCTASFMRRQRKRKQSGAEVRN